MPRRPRTPASYARRGPQREPYDLVLIVCEGAKTEPFYFEGLRHAWRLSSANIQVRSAGASDPLSLVAHALQTLRNDAFDRAYCVFDRDSHAGFAQALGQIAQSPEGQAGRLEAIVSWPCFEIWILLHFAMTTRAFVARGGRLPCDQVIREISRHLAGYAKGSKGVFASLEDRLATALTHADRLSAHNLETGSDNPGTTVHKLVNYLKSLKPQ